MDIEKDKNEKPQKRSRAQYIIWWYDGVARREYGPVYNRQVALRDSRFYQRKYGPTHAGMELYDEAREMRRRPRW